MRSTLKLPLCGLVAFTDMNTYVLTYAQNAGISKHSRKKIMQLLWIVVISLLRKS